MDYYNCKENFSHLSLLGILTLIIPDCHIHLVPSDFPNSPNLIIRYCTLLENWLLCLYIMLKVLCRSRNTLFQSGVNFPFTKTLLPNMACQVTLTIFKGLLYFLIRWVALNLTANLSPETFWHLAQFSFPHLISSSSSSVILFERNIYQQAPINLYCEAKKSTPRTFLGN